MTFSEAEAYSSTATIYNTLDVFSCYVKIPVNNNMPIIKLIVLHFEINNSTTFLIEYFFEYFISTPQDAHRPTSGIRGGVSKTDD